MGNILFALAAFSFFLLSCGTSIPILGSFAELEKNPREREIIAKWEELKPRYMGVRFAETPSIQHPYKPGKLQDEYLIDALNITKFFRFLAGLPIDNELSPELGRQAQYGAVIMAAISNLTHTPSRPRDMDQAVYSIAYKSTTSSNIHLSDNHTEFQINDRRTFMRFLGLKEHDKVPDAKSIWAWREQLTKRGVFERLFNRLWRMLEAKHISTSKGTIVDATFVEVPKQRNSGGENDEVKRGKVPEEWTKPENEPMLQQKDTDAHWAKNGEETHFGYKNYVRVDPKTKLIMRYAVADAQSTTLR